ncbi:MAG: putative RDD family membrane protein YckC [Verrucomicrobiales bacterium]|jgi:uncharacterized RDD family membrane protein YckC
MEDNADTQAPRLKLYIAGRMRRGMAKVVDFGLITAAYYWWWFESSQWDGWIWGTLSKIGAFTIGIVGAWLIWCAYNFVMTWIFQATIGKALLGMRVRSSDGRRVGFFGALFRTIGESLSFLLLGLGYFMALFDTTTKQTLHDRFAGSIVVLR